MAEPRVVLDCRWLGHAGPGRVTELLLSGLRMRPSPIRWILWGPKEVEEFAWPEADVVPIGSHPSALRGQAAWFSIPRCDLAVFLHQQRPLRAVPAVSVIYDTIPLRFAKNAADLWLKRQFLRTVVRRSRHVITFSEYSRNCIRLELGADEHGVTALMLPISRGHADHLIRLRLNTQKQDSALYVGRFLPHKNVKGLVEAFGQTNFAAQGGRLVLAGGSEEEASELTKGLARTFQSFIDVRCRCSQAELDNLFAESAFLIQPSIEEGFGLPVWEALSCGMPVCASDAGSLPEITFGLVQHFSRGSVPAMVRAIDVCATIAAGWTPADASRVAGEMARKAPTVEEFAARFEEVVIRNL